MAFDSPFALGAILAVVVSLQFAPWLNAQSLDH